MKSQSTPKLQRLLEALRKRAMTHEEMVRFLLRGVAPYNSRTRTHFDSTLYGTVRREGILERFARQRKDGKWRLKSHNMRVQAPFIPVRALTSF